jgi:AraC family transcriptional regulator, activator of mtrCDE
MSRIEDASRKPMRRISRSDLEGLMNGLAVDFVKLAECIVSDNCRLSLPAANTPMILYGLTGAGRTRIAEHPPIDVLPHVLIIVPRGQPFFIEASADRRTVWTGTTIEADMRGFEAGSLRRFAAGGNEPVLTLICGRFGATLGGCIDLFTSLPAPIVEPFEADHRLDLGLKFALAELAAQEAGTGAMTSALLKQVLITLMRRSLTSRNVWVESFAMLSDPPIARAFADMVARPGAPHSVQSLSQNVGLSRSVFMSRFTAALGCAPMAALRKLRMRQAALLLTTNRLKMDQVCYGVGYASRSSFFRAFRKTYGSDPSDYRAAAHDLLNERLPRHEGLRAGG